MNDDHKRPLTEAQIEEISKINVVKNGILGSKRQKTESPKINSKVLYELLVRSYEQFKFFFRNLEI